jgi:hypothetical protein
MENIAQINKAALKVLKENRVAVFIVAYNASKHIEKVSSIFSLLSLNPFRSSTCKVLTGSLPAIFSPVFTPDKGSLSRGQLPA